MADVTDMRGYIELLEEMGELRRIEGADLNTEVGALTELAAEEQVIDARVVLVDALRDQPQPEHSGVEVDVGAGIPGDGADVMNSFESHLAD